MKTGKTIQELAAEIARQSASKKDFMVATEAMAMEFGGEALRLTFAEHQLHVGPIAHDQLGDHVGVPTKYYRRMMAEAPALLALNVNHWLHANPTRQMVRTLDGRARAFLSDKYRPMDNEALAEAVLPVLADLGCDVVSSEITEKRLYIKAVDAHVARELRDKSTSGHGIVRLRTLNPLVTISNSEVGYGALMVASGTFDGFCTNGAIFERNARKNHIGSRYGEFSEDQVYAMLTDGTRRLNDAALWATIRDVVRGAFDAARFDALVGRINETQDQPLTGSIPKVVEVTAARFGLNEGERKSVLDHLIKGADLSRFGLYNAVTRTAEDVEDYDRATELERMGGQIIELPANDWRVLAEAA